MKSGFSLRPRRGAASHLALFAWLAAGCSGDSRETALSTGPSTANGAVDDAGSTGGGDPTNSGGNGSTGSTGGSDDGLTIDSSFIWIANTDEGTVSKLDTRATPIVELARYRTSPNSQGKPSRTSVGFDGSVAVANRGGTSGQPSLEAGITKIYASEDRCVDANGNGTIDTSHSKTEVLAWGEDECVAWHRPLDYWSNRPVAWAPVQLDSDEGAKVWTAGSTTCSNSACNFDVLRINGETGEIEDTIPVGPLMGPDFTGAGAVSPFPLPFPIPGGSVLENYGPYGGASDAGGNFWMFTGTTTHLVRVDALSLEVRSWPVPEANGYGIAIDRKGRVFVCGMQGVSRFDPATEQWQASSATNIMLGYNGCMVDGKDTIWVGGGGDSGQNGLHAFNIDTLAWIATHDVGPVKGVSIDIDGYVWGVSGGNANAGGGFGGLPTDRNSAHRLDPMTGKWETYSGLNNPYSYSDMTGFGLKQAGVIPLI